MFIGQNNKSLSNPKIVQTVSGGSLQPSQPSDSFDMSPERPSIAPSLDKDPNYRSYKFSNNVEGILEQPNDSTTEREGNSPLPQINSPTLVQQLSIEAEVIATIPEVLEPVPQLKEPEPEVKEPIPDVKAELVEPPK